MGDDGDSSTSTSEYFEAATSYSNLAAHSDPTRSKAQSVLIIGATGKVGIETLRQLAKQSSSHHQQRTTRNPSPSPPPPPLVYGLTRDLMHISRETMQEYMKYGESLIEGDPTDASDIYRALLISNADTIIISVGSGKKRRSNVRTNSARAIAQVLRHPPFRRVRVIVVSWAHNPAALFYAHHHNNKFHLGLGKLMRGSLMSSVLKDHTGQEGVFMSDKTLFDRTTIVRPTRFRISNKTKTSGTSTVLQTFDDSQVTAARQKTSQLDLARWVVEEVLQHNHTGSVVNVSTTSMKSQ